MKILVFHLQGAKRAKLFGDERLENLLRLMDMGCFGELDGNPSEWNILARHESHTLTLGEFLAQAGKDVATFDESQHLAQASGQVNPFLLRASATPWVLTIPRISL